MRCAKCGTDSPAGNNFCVQCGNALNRLCAKCGAENPPTSNFCGKCGASLAGGAGAAVAPSTRPESGHRVRVVEQSDASLATEGERKTVTALFADIKGSTELEQDLDPEEARAIVDPALKLMIDAAQRYDGYVVQSTGDGIFAIFGAPVAHEDHPQRALYSALRMQEELRRYSTKLVADGGNPLQCRVGVNTGEVVVRSISTGGGHVEYTPIGHTTNLASRMQAVAPVGSIAVAEPTRKLCEGYFTLKPLGPTKVKGVSDAVNVFEVTGLGPLRTRLQRSASRGYTKFVGRHAEMEALKRAAELARSGRGQIVAAVAEPGVGKSRLFFEFKATSQSGWLVLEAFSVSHGKASAYLPVLDLLHSYFGIDSDDDTRKRREKVIGKVLGLDRALEDALPHLFGLLGLIEGDDPLAGMDAQIRRRRTLDAVKRVLLRESLNQPLIVVFEDLHWIDDETQTLLNLLADSIANAKILLLVNYRPEYSHQWNSKTYYTQLRLDPLGRESADEMLTTLLGSDESVAPLKRLIAEKTEGNPLFMEEIFLGLLEDGAVARNGSLKLVKPLASLRIPPTVHGILAARIDRLPANEKELLQSLAVIGTEFPLALAREVTGQPDDELERILNQLQLAEFIYEQPAAGDVEYSFKHALTQEVAYNSVLQERRKSLHERIGTAIEALYADALDDHVEQLAHHYRRSANAPKAIDYLARAAEQAVVRNAPNEAVPGYENALALLDGIGDPMERERREASLQTALGGALQMGSPAAPGLEKVYLRARELCERIGDREGLFNTLFGLRLYYSFRAELSRALELGDEMLKIARNDDPLLQSSAHVSAAQARYFLGDLSAARRHLELALATAPSATQRPAGHQVSERMMTTEPWSRNGLILGLLGYPDQAVHEVQKGLAHARAYPVPIAAALAEFFAAQLYFFLRDARKVRQHSGTASRIATQHGNAQIAGYAAAFLGWSEALEDDAGEGIKQIRQAMEQVELVGSRIHSLQDTLLIDCHLRLGQVQEGLSAASEALAHARSTRERYCESEINRLKGELLILNNDRESAEAAFRAAIEVARGQEARWWELRATASLARLLRDTNRRDEARAMLAEIYNWFTEGFDTADLKDAKALIEELGG